MKIDDIKFLNKGRLSERAMDQIRGGLKNCDNNGGSYFISCVTIYGTCSPWNGLCWGDTPGKKISCGNFTGHVPCEPYDGSNCHWDSSKSKLVEVVSY